ncbi:MAG TPA: hypothetical protein VN327_10640, partial [Pseudonocardiaceae bacterium]|nr:hypothetical protein [Pseudonocardiaceae bacterium]
ASRLTNCLAQSGTRAGLVCIVLDPHVAGCCVIELDEDQAIAVRNTLTQWLGGPAKRPATDPVLTLPTFALPGGAAHL